MSNDELFVFLACIIIASIAAKDSIAIFFAPRWRNRAISLAFSFAVLTAVAIVVAAVSCLSDRVVSSSGFYILLFVALGIVWLRTGMRAFVILGLSVRDDIFDNANPSAASALGGAVLGLAVIYAGSNIGTGPTIWTTIVPAAMATLAWLTLWLVFEIATNLSERIAVERHLASGVMLAALLLALAVIIAASVAGDWVSYDATLRDLERGMLYSIGVTAIAIAVDRTLHVWRH